MTTHTAPSTRPGSSWSIPVALVALIIIPMVAGSLRILEVTGGPQLLPANPRIADSPAPLVIHVVAAGVFAVVGAFQFPARLRRRHRTWHRRAGRVLVAAGLLVAGSGLWMTLFYPDAPGGALLWTARLVAGSATAVSLALGFTAIRRRDFPAHRAWMIRAYALSVAAGTQILTQGFGEGVFGVNELSTGLSVSAGWLINAVLAEWIIRRPPRPPGTVRDGRDLTMPNGRDAPLRYEVRIEGHLDRRWSAWFDSLALTHEPDGTTTLRGNVTDQAQLHGLLAKVRDLGATLLSVTPLDRR